MYSNLFTRLSISQKKKKKLFIIFAQRDYKPVSIIFVSLGISHV